MLVYLTLRRVALTLRSIQMMAARVTAAASSAAERTGDIAKGAAGYFLAQREDKAYRALDQARAQTEAGVSQLLAREDALEDEVTEVLADNAELRRQIFTEVL